MSELFAHECLQTLVMPILSQRPPVVEYLFPMESSACGVLQVCQASNEYIHSDSMVKSGTSGLPRNAGDSSEPLQGRELFFPGGLAQSIELGLPVR